MGLNLGCLHWQNMRGHDRAGSVAFFLSSMGAKMQLAAGTAAGPSSQREYLLLNQQVVRKCLMKLMGIGQHRLEKVESSGPDLRHGSRPYQSRLESYSVDAFLQNAYDSIAETLPHQSLKRQGDSCLAVVWKFFTSWQGIL